MDSQLKTFLTEMRSDVTGNINTIRKRLDHVEMQLERPLIGGGSDVSFDADRLAKAVWESDGWRQFKAAGGRGRFAVQLEQSLYETKTTIDSGAVGSSTPGVLTPQRFPGVVKPGVRRIRVRDLMNSYLCSNNAVDFVKEDAFTNAASPQVESSAKGESALTFTVDSANVRTVATWIPASRQVLDDFGQLRTYIDERLIDGLNDELDFQLLRGDGAGSHIEGMLPQATAYDTARNASGDTYLDKLNHAISQIEDANLTATGIILHPRDWRTIQLQKTEEGGANKGMYILNGPVGNANPMIWGLPVATTTATQVGKFFVCDFMRGCAIFDRMQTVVEFSDSHSDYFVKNLVAIRAELRLAFVVFRSDALIYGSF